MQLLHQLTFQTNYKFSPCPYNRLTIHFIPLICKRHRSHTLSQTFTLATFNFSPHIINQHLTPVFSAYKTSSNYSRTLNVCSPLNAAEYLFLKIFLVSTYRSYMRDVLKALIMALYLCNQHCNKPENCTKLEDILCLYTALTSFM